MPADVIVDEERIARHNFHHFYPANPGDVLLDRFKLISKIGWGTTSTVWLAGDNKKYSLDNYLKLLINLVPNLETEFPGKVDTMPLKSATATLLPST